MQFNKKIQIGNFEISERSKTFIIAEAGVNHNGDLSRAKQLIDVAIEAGVDAVKFQTFKTGNVILKDVPKAPYQRQTTDSGESQFDMVSKLEFTKEQTFELKKYCDEKGIMFLTTAFDEVSLAELDDFDLPAYKIASTDITNLPFLKSIAKKKKPIFLSTGMTYFPEIILALEEINACNQDVVLLQCTANYPIKDEEANLMVVKTFKEKFDMIVGYSDHSLGLGAAPYAVAMGAKVIEKHFTLDKNLEGPDHKASLSPDELKELVCVIRKVEEYCGSDIKKPTLSELETRKALQRNFVAAKMIDKGEVFTEDNLTQKRTAGIGISPIHYKKVFGVNSKKKYDKNEIISAEELQG